MSSLLDLKTAIRFIVMIFGYSLGFATAYSVYVPANRSSEALPSPNSDDYPIMIAQVAGSLMSPLLSVSYQSEKAQPPSAEGDLLLLPLTRHRGPLVGYVSPSLLSLACRL
ncbi:hypothetical protein GGR53DRAFT_489994 [Hypoxylon sp. FL1150]|nr:hypothetical protein GGR53DRAFT_489994 [Hypoxylon sp. FL1150]